MADEPDGITILTVEQPPLQRREYLADGVYAGFDGWQIWLEAERDGRTHTIAVDDDVFAALVAYREKLIAAAKSGS